MNKENLTKLTLETVALLDQLENGKTFLSSNIVNRLEKVASVNSKDILISSMTDVVRKISDKKEFITQKEIGDLYNKLSKTGHNSQFRDYFSDLLPDNMQLNKIAYPTSPKRSSVEAVQPMHKDSELSDAFSVLFSLGQNNATGTYKTQKNKNVEKTVINKLSHMGQKPIGVDVIKSNEHFTMCSARIRTASNNHVEVLIPVQTTNGIISEPEHIILANNELADLTDQNLFIAMKEKENEITSTNKAAKLRGDNLKPFDVKKVDVPKALLDFTNIDKTIIAASNNFNNSIIKNATEVISREVRSFGLRPSTIKIADSSANELVFDVHFPTASGNVAVQVPIEINNDNVLLPSNFYVSGSSESKYDFSQDGFGKFIRTLTPDSSGIKIARDNGFLKDMSYDTLMQEVIAGVANKNYTQSEDALSIISQKFGFNKFVHAQAEFGNLLKHSTVNDEKEKLVTAALKSGELVHRKNHVEPYCPSLGLPLSKVTFDETGRVISLHRAKLNKLQNGKK